MTQKSNSWAWALVALAAALFLHQRQAPAPGPGPSPAPAPAPIGPLPAPPVVPDDLRTGAQLAAAMTGATATADARWLAAVTSALAGLVVEDGGRPDPLLRDRLQAQQLARNLGTLATGPRLGSRYPGLGPVIAGAFARTMPPQPGALEPADRQALARTLAALALGFGQVGGGPR